MSKLSKKIQDIANIQNTADTFLGTITSTDDLIGLIPKDGALVMNRTTNTFYVFDEVNGWTQIVGGGGGGITDVVQDLTPQLGGDLNLNNNDIVGTGNINGRNIATDGAKLDTIETNATADQTGAEIVTLIDTQLGGSTWQTGGSGSTDLSYTAATGVIASSSGADATLTLADGTNRGLMSNTDFTKLASIEALADVTDDANVKAALDGMTLTDAGTPASTDKVLIQDTSDSNNLKYVQVSTLGGGSSDHGSLTGLTDDDHTQYSIISTGTTAPASTPARPGALFIDTTADNVYVATGNASSADWQEQVKVDGTGLVNGELLIWDSASTSFKRDNREVVTTPVTAVNMNSISGNYYTGTSTSGTITLNNILAGGKSTIRLQNATTGGPTISGTGVTVTKLGDWSTNFDTTNINTVFIEMVTTTLAYCWITAVD
jgi:hypothetical protein